MLKKELWDSLPQDQTIYTSEGTYLAICFRQEISDVTAHSLMPSVEKCYKKQATLINCISQC